MSLDVYNLSPKELSQLNSSLLKYKENSLLKLHNLQRVNHNLIIENTKLRQTLKYGSKETESLLMGHRDLKGKNVVKPMQVTVETSDDYTAMVYFKCLLSPSEISDYFNCDFSDLTYKVVLVEWNNDLVENASTVLTKQSQLKLKMLQNNIRYLVTVHLHGKDRKISGQTQFVYNQSWTDVKAGDPFNLKSLECQLKQVEKGPKTTELSQQVGEQKEDGNIKKKEGKEDGSELNTNVMEYCLNVQIDEDYYVTCKFSEKDPVENVVDAFMEKNKLKGFLRESLLKCVTELKSSGNSIKTVDVSDLI